MQHSLKIIKYKFESDLEEHLTQYCNHLITVALKPIAFGKLEAEVRLTYKYNTILLLNSVDKLNKIN